METKKNKYDTNPLDPDVERKAEESWGFTEPTQNIGGATQEVGNESARKNAYSEAPTRRYDSPPLEQPYPSVFVPPTYAPPTQYQPPPGNPYYRPAANQSSNASAIKHGWRAGLTLAVRLCQAWREQGGISWAQSQNGSGRSRSWPCS